MREAPAYRVPEAALYLGIPKATLRYWVGGARYRTQGGVRAAPALIRTPEPFVLSFLNLVEAHVLDAIRREHKISLQAVRYALGYVAKRFPSEHPLADQSFATDGADLFVEQYGSFVNASAGGQIALKDVLRAYLRRIERDDSGLPIRLYPFTRKTALEEPRRIAIDPRVQFGRPVIVGTGIPTEVIAERFKAGESIDDLARDYGRPLDDVQEAVRAELCLHTAA